MLLVIPIGLLMLVFHLLPVLQKETYFAVRVTPEYRNSSESRAILGRYRLVNLFIALVSAALMYGSWKSAWPLGMSVGPLFYAGGMAVATWFFHRRVLLNSQPASSVRAASLTPDFALPLWAWILGLLPVLILAGAACLLAVQWAEIPDGFPVHWGMNGQPDRWSVKSIRGVYGILIVGASTLIVCYVPWLATIFGARRSHGEDKMLRAFTFSMLGVLNVVALTMGLIALQPLAPSPDKMPLPPLALALLPLGIVALSILPMWKVSQETEGDGDTTPDECWYAGAYYYNPDDSAWMVRNRMGMGYSPNFGNRIIQIGFPILLLQLLAAIFYITR